MKMPSNMTHRFSEVPEANIPRSIFDRTFTHKTTFDAGYLIPFLVDEVLPGDTFNVDATLFGRLQTPIVPFMDNLWLDTFFFFVPNRLIWDNWERFNGAQDDPNDSVDFLTPVIPAPTTDGWAVGSLFDYFGIPTDIDNFSVCNFWGRAYNLIWNEWFRDQNLQNSVVVDKDNGPDAPTDYVLLKRGKRHDYFTSCLPWPQKGPGVNIPLAGDAPVTGLGKWTQVYDAGPVAFYETDGSAPVNYADYIVAGTAANSQVALEEDPNNPGFPNVRADLSGVQAATINSLRQAFQIQKLYERDARGGTRYTEILRAHFSVISPDARLQRPEFLGGNSTAIMVKPVEQNAPPTDAQTVETPQGNLAGRGEFLARREGFTKSFVEHGVLIGLMMVRADLTYQQGLERMFSRRTRWDFYWPALAHIGEQAVLNQEIYMQGVPGTEPDEDQGVFGYQERWAEYRYKPSKITGKLRSTAAASLDIWHLSQEFEALPELDAAFITEDPPVDRVIAVTNEPQFIFDSFIKMRCVRPMPVYSVPGLIDHF